MRKHRRLILGLAVGLVIAVALGVRTYRQTARYGRFVVDGQRAAEDLLRTNPPAGLHQHRGKLIELKGSGFSLPTFGWQLTGFYYLRLERVGVFSLSRGTLPVRIVVMANEDSTPGRTNIWSQFENLPFDPNQPLVISISHPFLFAP